MGQSTLASLCCRALLLYARDLDSHSTWSEKQTYHECHEAGKKEEKDKQEKKEKKVKRVKKLRRTSPRQSDKHHYHLWSSVVP